MKWIFKTIMICLIVCVQIQAKSHVRNTGVEKDSVIIKFGDKSKVIIYAHSKADMDAILNLDMNKLLRDIKQKLDTVSVSQTTLHEEISGNDYLKIPIDSSDKALQAKIYMQIDSTEIKVAWNLDKESDSSAASQEENKYKKIYKSGFGSSPRKGFNVKLGLNRYGQNEPGNLYSIQEYDLKPWASRFISLEYIASTRLAKGKNKSLHLDFGLDVSWFNLMFDGNNTITKKEENVSFPTGQVQAYRKSKLVIPNLNLSLMPTLKFSKSVISYVSAGMYGGYRLGSYAKTIEKGTKVKNKEHANFHLYDFRYGLAMEIGIRKFPDLFVNYDLNETFKNAAGPKVKMISFGIRLF